MANTRSARKAARQGVRRNARNAAQRSKLRTAIKNARKAIAAGNKESAKAAFDVAQSIIDSSADKDLMHKNAAARHKSRLASALKALALKV